MVGQRQTVQSWLTTIVEFLISAIVLASCICESDMLLISTSTVSTEVLSPAAQTFVLFSFQTPLEFQMYFKFDIQLFFGRHCYSDLMREVLIFQTWCTKGFENGILKQIFITFRPEIVNIISCLWWMLRSTDWLKWSDRKRTFLFSFILCVDSISIDRWCGYIHRSCQGNFSKETVQRTSIVTMNLFVFFSIT